MSKAAADHARKFRRHKLISTVTAAVGAEPSPGPTAIPYSPKVPREITHRRVQLGPFTGWRRIRPAPPGEEFSI